MGGAGPDPEFVERVGTKRVIYANGGVARITTGWRLGRQLETVFREGRLDVVHVHGGPKPVVGLLAPPAAIRPGHPPVATLHPRLTRPLRYTPFPPPPPRP